MSPFYTGLLVGLGIGFFAGFSTAAWLVLFSLEPKEEDDDNIPFPGA